MTALNFSLNKDVVGITMDTLCSDPNDKSPLLFTSKIYPLPHLDGVLCGTGIGLFVLKWFQIIENQFVVRDIEGLDRFAPNALRSAFSEYASAGIKSRSTIYHFGYQQERAEFMGFAYRSTSDFVSEPLNRGAGFKPPPSSIMPGQEIGYKHLPDYFIEIMKQQRADDETEAVEKKVGIGGDIHYFTMQKSRDTESGLPIISTLYRCHRFSDYQKIYIEMLNKNPVSVKGNEE